MPTLPVVVMLLTRLLEGQTTPIPAGGPAVLRLAALEGNVCLTGCPPIPTDASSDWLRSAEGQQASGCHLSCRTSHPATELYRELAEQAARGTLTADTPLVKLAGRDRAELVARLVAAVKEAGGRKLGPFCVRARERVGPRDETSYFDCISPAARPGAAAGARPPDPARALRCATAFAERDLDWLKRCPALEARTDIGGCVTRAEDAAAAKRQPAGDARGRCENDALEWLANSFRGRP